MMILNVTDFVICEERGMLDNQEIDSEVLIYRSIS